MAARDDQARAARVARREVARQEAGCEPGHGRAGIPKARRHSHRENEGAAKPRIIGARPNRARTKEAPGGYDSTNSALRIKGSCWRFARSKELAGEMTTSIQLRT
jgi:hypothetical protein